MTDEPSGSRAETDELGQLAEALVAHVRDFINQQWDWACWMTEHPNVPEGSEGPVALPPGFLSDSDWTITYEGAYPWADAFGSLEFVDGPVKRFLDANRLHVEIETGYAISISRLKR